MALVDLAIEVRKTVAVQVCGDLGQELACGGAF